MQRPRRILTLLAVAGALVAPSAGGAIEAEVKAQVKADTLPDEQVQGQVLLNEQPKLLDEVAEVNDLTQAETADLLADEAAWVDHDGHIFFADPPRDAPEAADGPAPTTSAIVPYADTFTLNSKPGSPRTLYIDFDGHTFSGTAWPADDAGPYTALPYNPDGKAAFGAVELETIQEVWQRVAEDYAPFDINVTTQDPGSAKIRRDSSTDDQYGTRVAVTDSTPKAVINLEGPAGYAYYDAFDAIGTSHDQLQPAWAFTDSASTARTIAETVSHEAGHNLGLAHDGTATLSYYGGHDLWAPIMGSGYRTIIQWSKGEYTGANNTQDDFAVMAQHGLSTRADDHTDSTSTATALTTTGAGIIAAAADKDLFKYVAPSTGSVTFAAKPSSVSPNLDIKLTLLSSAGAQLATNNPPAAQVNPWTLVATGLDAAITHSVTAGTTYYLRVEPTGHLTAATGYTTYGSLGQYTLTASTGSATCASQDTLEPNNSWASASPAASGQAIASRICSGDLDYYAIPAVAGQNINLSLLFSHASGNLDLSLWSPTGSSVAASNSTDNDEAINVVAAETGLYLAEVSGKSGAAATYSFTSTSAVCPPDDAQENDDTVATAKPGQIGTPFTGISCPDDDDYYSIPVSAGQLVDVWMERSPSLGFIYLEIVSSTGALIDNGGFLVGSNRIVASATATTNDVWRVHVSAGDAVNGYMIGVKRTPEVATVPPAPTGVSATAGGGQATVSWTAPSTNGGSSLTGYVVTPFIGGTAQTARTFNSTSTSQVITGLTPGTTYTFKVAAKNAIGTGAQSNASNEVTPTTAPYLPFASWDALIKRVYADLISRQPTASELSSWKTKLSSSSNTKGDLADSLRRSSESTGPVDATARLYRAFLGRAPDPSGLKFWIGRRRSGNWSLTKMADSFANSNEFKTKYGTLTNLQFVTLIYTDVMGRPADPSGVTYWTNKLNNKSKTRGGVMIGFSESNEYKTLQAENTDVAVAYILLMNKQATVEQTTDWVTRQKNGTTHANLLLELLNSPAYSTYITG